jgi:hypothetical protein
MPPYNLMSFRNPPFCSLDGACLPALEDLPEIFITFWTRWKDPGFLIPQFLSEPVIYLLATIFDTEPQFSNRAKHWN